MQKPFVKWGVIASGLGIAITLLAYLINPSSISNLWVGFISFGLMIYCATKASLEERALQGGYMTWGQALVPALLAILIYFVVSMLFSYVLTTIIDPTLIKEQTEASIEIQEKIRNFLGSEMTDAEIEELRKKSEPTLVNMIVGGFFAMLCFGFLFSAIIAIFVAKKNPENDLLA